MNMTSDKILSHFFLTKMNNLRIVSHIVWNVSFRDDACAIHMNNHVIADINVVSSEYQSAI